MNYLIMISQKSYSMLSHIMAELNSVKKSEWPEKFKSFESTFLGFKKQRMESKPQVGNIVEHKELNGFLQTLVGYGNMVDAYLKAPKKGLNHLELVQSQKLMALLRTEINTQLLEQGFKVN